MTALFPMSPNVIGIAIGIPVTLIGNHPVQNMLIRPQRHRPHQPRSFCSPAPQGSNLGRLLPSPKGFKSGSNDCPQLSRNRRVTQLNRLRTSYSGWITGNPHLTRRWPFGRVTEGLPTSHQERKCLRIQLGSSVPKHLLLVIKTSCLFVRRS
ncbi:MAG: hypothetical protein QOE55_537 [Acidobacteriaceae bacterium]|jgi:hypothetical protein|nr:hypothetical protein [Acidobacteriaceae bacterium]